MGKLMTKFNEYACPICGGDLETVIFEANSAYRGQAELQIPCVHCQKELIISNWLEAGSLEILLNEREGAENV